VPLPDQDARHGGGGVVDQGQRKTANGSPVGSPCSALQPWAVALAAMHRRFLHLEVAAAEHGQLLSVDLEDTNAAL
jgi:hypothetical protein